MKNILTLHIESYLGAVFISIFAIFCIGLVFIALKNFNSDISIINATQTRVRFE